MIFITFFIIAFPIFANSISSSAITEPKQTDCTCGYRNSQPVTRIVGGEPAQYNEIPWRIFIGIVQDGKIQSCGGTIINEHWIMTAAHCPVSPEAQVRVYDYIPDRLNPSLDVHEFSRQYFIPKVEDIIDHEDFNVTTFENDIRLIYSERPLFGPRMWGVAACLPWNLQNFDFSNGTALASGWGTTEIVEPGQENNGQPSLQLKKLELPIISNEECRKYFPTLPDNMICTNKPGSDTCQGDSGASIDYSYNEKYFAIGITSSGLGCARVPGRYTRVTKYLQWIKDNTKDRNGVFCNQ